MSQALLTDLYELTMMAGYHAEGRSDEQATFDLYFRRPPAGVDLVVAAGLDLALDYLERLRFSSEDLDYLASLALFDDEFLAYLSQLRFRGDVWAIREGTPVFPDEPLLRVTAPLGQAQLVETALLNLVCYSCVVASNAAQIVAAAGGKRVIEFGARRAQGPDGAVTGARAAVIGGCAATSNVEAGRRFGAEVSGTQAHSWVMAFDSELEAFRAYARAFPDRCILLVDTYDTLGIGVPNAITVAGELRDRGHELDGIRLDSGDLGDLAVHSRRRLDDAGFPHVRIVASGDLDAERVAALEAAGAPIDAYGVGTALITAKQDPALSGVYKMVEINGQPAVKLSGTPGKGTTPGRKQVWRTDEADTIGLADESLDGEPLLVEVMRSGERRAEPSSLAELRERCGELSGQMRPKALAGWPVRRSQRLEDLRATVSRHLRDGIR
ncbi:MAG TPA: nicotinate phosphoribosyltransferase [Egibacteraceae bacterium]|nr:nicotinate phosphoribosyltransferase [Egibacteraceae bacterium]